ncbi:hypothetical protein VIRA109638_05530 [Vibrio rarus]
MTRPLNCVVIQVLRSAFQYNENNAQANVVKG